jgi:integrase
VCHWKGRRDRFFGKYKSFDTGKWLKIPGGVFPAAFNTREKAIVFAAEWYAQEKAEREARTAAEKSPSLPTWNDICDAYVAEVEDRMRGKPSTRHAAITITNASLRHPVLLAGIPADNDESRCVLWLHTIARENIAKSKRSRARTRKPNTLRNIARQLRCLFKMALRRRMIPGMVTNPAMGDEFADEVKALMSRDDPREWLLPVDEFGKLVSCALVPAMRRLFYLTMGLAGLRPGEVAGIQFKHVRDEALVRFVAVEQQWATPRGRFAKAGVQTLKTKWSKRNIPVHPALRPGLDEWIASGWEAWTGRAHTQDDFVFVNRDGTPYREEHADTFRADLEAAGCATTFAGEALTPYALRHMFSTLLTEGHAADAAHDRLMGHRPRDTKTLNYSAKLLPFLAREIARLDFTMPSAEAADQPLAEVA